MSRTDDAVAEISARCLGLRVRLLDRAITSVYDRHLRPLGLRITQLTVLTAIAKAGQLGPGDLVHHLRMEKSTVSRTLDRLIDQGWVEALETEDARSYRVRLTRVGRAKLDEAHPHWQAAQVEAESLLGRENARALRTTADAVGQDA